MDGFILADKPKGMTSQSVCNRIKRRLGLEKCGHNGTLDPNTTGILVVACNRATKLLKLISEHDKEYIATIVFGYDSDTLDIDGEITACRDMEFTMEDLTRALETIKEAEEQLPPLTSAIKVNGRKLYEYQRKGLEVEVYPRKVKLYEYTVLSNLRMVNGHLEVDIRLHVSKGFYVRSLARDLGKALGGCAVLKDLRRTRAGEFRVEDAIPLEEVTKDSINGIEEVFPFPRVEVNAYIAKLVLNGVMLDERQTKEKGVFYVTHNCDIIAIYEAVEPLKYKPILLFK